MTPVMYWLLGALAGSMVTCLVMFRAMSALVEDHRIALAALSVDAGRYRWLRLNHGGFHARGGWVCDGDGPDYTDTVIDNELALGPRIRTDMPPRA